MRPIRRTLAIDASIVLLAAASAAELWIGHRADATIVTTVLAIGTSASLLTWRSSPVAAVVAASAAQAALVAEMPRPMISSVIALAATAVIAGASAAGTARTEQWAAAIGPTAAILVGADYAFRIRTTDQIAAFAIIVASLVVLWAFGHWVVRRPTAPPAAAPVNHPAARAEAPGDEGAAAAQPPAPTQRRARVVGAKVAGAKVGGAKLVGAKVARDKKEAGAAEDAELAERRLAVARDLAGTVTAGLNAVLVETVAAQQGLVRDAHPEDVLLRVRAAEEHARTAIDDVRRLLTVTAVVPAAEDPVALDR